MQLSKPAHGLRETCLHELLQTVSYVFWNEKWELFRKDVCYIKKLMKRFFEAYVFKKQKTKSVRSDFSLEFWYAVGAYLLIPAYSSGYSL